MKYFLWVLGCAMNYSDAERIASVLRSLEYEPTTKESEADLIITIACSVRQTAIDRIYGKAKVWKKLKIKNEKLRIILTGCVLEKDLRKFRQIFDFVFKIEDIGGLSEFLNSKSETLNDKQIQISKAENLKLNNLLEIRNSKLGFSGEYLAIKPEYESSFRAYVPIMTGCNNFCSYCAVPYTRGREKSRPAVEIIAEVTSLVEKGYKEITLLGQNVNSYGNDFKSVIPTAGPNDLMVGQEAEESLKKKKGISRQARNDNFVSLLNSIDKIPGDYRVYFYSNHPKDMSDDLIETLPKLKHFPKYLHLPLQSGNNEIIKKMNRHYTKEQYLLLVAKIRKAMPGVVLTTDIIVGFPGEGVKEFGDTIDVVKKAKFEMIFIGQYSPRPGTRSAKMPDEITKTEKKKRDRAITDLLAENLKNVNQKLIGTTQKVLIDGEKGGKFYGRTEGYKVVEIENRNHPERAKRAEGSPKSKTDQVLKLGQFVSVEIRSANAWKLNALV